MEYTIIIPTFNSARHLPRVLSALSGVLRGVDGIEVVVVDGGSHDATLSMVREFPGLRVVESPNRTIAQSRNLGAHAGSGENLVFLDSDCVPPARLLDLARERLRFHECVGAFYVPAPESGWIARTWLGVEAKDPGPVDWIIGGTLVVTRRAFEAVGGFDESLATGEDVDFGLRLRRAGFQPYHEPGLACQHIGQADDLVSFFRKEAWRGQSLVPSLRRHGPASRPSAFSALVMLHAFGVLLLAAGVIVRWPPGIVAGAGLTGGIPACLAARWGVRTRDWRRLAPVYVLYLLHLCARDWGMLRIGRR